MTLKDFIKGLDAQALEAYAAACNTTVNYLTTHILYATKEPSVRLMKSLAQQSGGAVGMQDVLLHYGLLGPEPVAA